jgi:uncharacterized protein YjbI with pentapeptide repeats
MVTISNEQYKGKELSSNKFVDNKRFVGCSFEKCNLVNYTFTNCDFEDCIFTNCNFSNTLLAQNWKYNSGQFVRCLFISCNLKATSFRFPIIDNCEFRNCILKETNFDGSRFSNTKFTSELDSCFFRGYSIYAETGSLFSFFKIDPLKVPNKMINVDFSLSKLVGVSFSNSIDLSNCILPKGEEYLYLSDLKKTMHHALETIKSEWADGNRKDTAVKLIDKLYYNNDRWEQSNDFIDSFIPQEMDATEGTDVGMDLFNLIKSLQ